MELTDPNGMYISTKIQLNLIKFSYYKQKIKLFNINHGLQVSNNRWWDHVCESNVNLKIIYYIIFTMAKLY